MSHVAVHHHSTAKRAGIHRWRIAAALGVVGILVGSASAQFSFAPHVIYPTATGARPNGIAVGDLNGDVRPDLAGVWARARSV